MPISQQTSRKSYLPRSTPVSKPYATSAARLSQCAFAFVFAAMAAVLVAASLFVAVCLRAPSEKKKDGRLTLSRFRKMKGMGESSAPEPATGEAVPEDASVAAPALI